MTDTEFLLGELGVGSNPCPVGHHWDCLTYTQCNNQTGALPYLLQWDKAISSFSSSSLLRLSSYSTRSRSLKREMRSSLRARKFCISSPEDTSPLSPSTAQLSVWEKVKDYRELEETYFLKISPVLLLCRSLASQNTNYSTVLDRQGRISFKIWMSNKQSRSRTRKVIIKERKKKRNLKT